MPLIRTGPRGSTSFRAASWEEALGLISARLGEIRDRHGPSSVLCLASGGSTGALHNTNALTRRFLNVTGGCTTLSGSYSNGAARAVLPFLLGSRWNASGSDAATMRSAADDHPLGGKSVGHSSRVGDAPKAARGEETGRRDRRHRSAALHDGRACIDLVVAVPSRTPTRPSCWRRSTCCSMTVSSTPRSSMPAPRVSRHWHAMCVEKKAVRRGRLPGRRICAAWRRRRSGVSRAPMPRPARPCSFPGFSIQRVHAGEETYRLAVALQLATGNFGMRGGSTGSMNNCLPTPPVGTIDPLVPAGPARVPVLEWPDLILQGTRGGYPVDIHAVYAAGSNYVNQGGDVHKSIAAFKSLDFAVCHDLFLTPTARSCDVVLPPPLRWRRKTSGFPGSAITCSTSPPRSSCAPPSAPIGIFSVTFPTVWERAAAFPAEEARPSGSTRSSKNPESPIAMSSRERASIWL